MGLFQPTVESGIVDKSWEELQIASHHWSECMTAVLSLVSMLRTSA